MTNERDEVGMKFFYYCLKNIMSRELELEMDLETLEARNKKEKIITFRWISVRAELASRVESSRDATKRQQQQ